MKIEGNLQVPILNGFQKCLMIREKIRIPGISRPSGAPPDVFILVEFIQVVLLRECSIVGRMPVHVDRGNRQGDAMILKTI